MLLKSQDLCRGPRPVLGEDGPQGALRPVSSSACPPPWGPQSAAQDPDRTCVGRTHGGGLAPPQTVVSVLTVGTADSPEGLFPPSTMAAQGNPAIPRETHLQEAGGKCTHSSHDERKTSARPHAGPMAADTGTRLTSPVLRTQRF